MKAFHLRFFTVVSLFTATLAGPAAAQVQGFGTDLPLEVVIKQLVPPTHQVVVAPGVDQTRATSWTGGRAWDHVLADALRPLGLTAYVDRSAVRIEPKAWRGASATRFEGGNGLLILSSNRRADPTVAPDEPASRATMSPTGTPSWSGETAPAGPSPKLLIPEQRPAGASNNQFASTDPGAAIAVEASSFNSWMASAGKDLREVLASWAEEAGWSVVWRSDYSYPLHASAVFDGQFTDAARRLLENFAKARPPIQATFYQGNRVLLIENHGDISGE